MPEVQKPKFLNTEDQSAVATRGVADSGEDIVAEVTRHRERIIGKQMLPAKRQRNCVPSRYHLYKTREA